MKRLAGKVALVTGGARGIGAGVAQRLAREGAHVTVSHSKYTRDIEGLFFSHRRGTGVGSSYRQ